MVAGSIVYCQLHLIGFVDFELVQFILPTIVLRGSCSSLEIIFDLDDDESIGTSAKTSGCGVVNIGDSIYAN